MTFSSEPDHLLFQTWMMAPPGQMEPSANSAWPGPVIRGYLLGRFYSMALHPQSETGWKEAQRVGNIS